MTRPDLNAFRELRKKILSQQPSDIEILKSIRKDTRKGTTMPKVFVISDNHFSDYDGPNGVIDIFHRPFKNSSDMNKEMVKRWNSVVKPEDTVFSIGDFAWTWLDWKQYAPKLNGHKTFILGNHDFQGDNWYTSFEGDEWQKSGLGNEDSVFLYLAVLTHNNRSFLLVHDPADVPKWWRGWVIHGHHHWMKEYPFISGKNKNINVACELLDYTPLDLDWILSLDIDNIWKMNTMKSEPELNHC